MEDRCGRACRIGVWHAAGHDEPGEDEVIPKPTKRQYQSYVLYKQATGGQSSGAERNAPY